jgi:flagellar biosynthesis/type III secretory pathway protein FliH
MRSSPEPPSTFLLPELPASSGSCGVPSAPFGERADGAIELPELDAGRTVGADGPTVRRTEADEAHDRGFAEGLREGTIRSEQRVCVALETLGRVGEYLHTAQSAFVRDRARDLHGLALAVARKLIQREVTADPALLRELVDRALELVPLEPHLEVRLNPDDLSVLLGGPSAPEADGKGTAIKWLGDPTIERGGFLVESPLRIVDGRTDFALRSLYERLEYE